MIRVVKEKKETVLIQLRIDVKDHKILSDIARKEVRPINSQYRMIIGNWINDNTNEESAFIEKVKIEINKDMF